MAVRHDQHCCITRSFADVCFNCTEYSQGWIKDIKQIGLTLYQKIKFLLRLDIQIKQLIVDPCVFRSSMNPVPLSFSQLITLRSPNYQQPESSPLKNPKKNKAKPFVPKSHDERRKSKTFHQYQNKKTKIQPSMVQNLNNLYQDAFQSNLLQSALVHVQRQAVQYQAAQEQLSNQMSSFALSRQPTQNNPLGSHNLVLKETKKKRNNRPLHSVNSELFEIDQQQKLQTEEQTRDRQYILQDKLLGQIQAVYEHIFGKQRSMNPTIYNTWKSCLQHQDKTQIYGNNVPYSHPRILPVTQIEKGFDQFYGQGKNRILYAGQQAVIIDSIQKYLSHCTNNPKKFGRKSLDIISEVLRQCKLEKLEENPVCMKQIQMHFLLMATKWRYSGKLNLKDKTLDTYLIVGKSNILDLRKQNALTRFLKGLIVKK